MLAITIIVIIHIMSIAIARATYDFVGVAANIESISCIVDVFRFLVVAASFWVLAIFFFFDFFMASRILSLSSFGKSAIISNKAFSVSLSDRFFSCNSRISLIPPAWRFLTIVERRPFNTV